MEGSGNGPVLSCAGLIRRYGDRTAVDGVGFEIASGETYGLLGPNGAGKTTTISMVCGLLSRHGGSVTVAGLPMSERTVDAKRSVGYVPQEVALYPDLTARENLAFFGRLQRLRGDDLRERIDEMLEVVGLADRADDRVDTYSGGMQRRLNIGAGLLHQPRLLVLDEPTVGVDPQSRHAILETVEGLQAGGMAVLYTTHYMEEAERLCDRVGIIDHGRLLAEGTRSELVALVGERSRIRLVGTGDLAAVARGINQAGAGEATVVDTTVEVLAADPRSVLPQVISVASSAGVTVDAVEVEEPDLEAVFLHLTGRALRD